MPEREDHCHHENVFDSSIRDGLNANGLSRPVIKADGRFDNPFTTWSPMGTLTVLAKWFAQENQSNVPTNPDELDKELPMVKPNFELKNNYDNKKFRITWIGHASVLIQVDKINILADPIFSNRASPVPFFGPKRFRPPACDVESLPPIDYVIISHNHYDHFDLDSARSINSRFGNKCRWLVPLGMGALLRSIRIENIVELDWWQKVCHCRHPNAIETSSQQQSGNTNATKLTPLSIYATPNQHWCKRTPFDYNRALWASYTVVSSSGERFFFAGDTGYCSAFKEIGNVFGPFQGAAIPIGAYSPRAMMLPAHVNPQEAIKIHQDIRCSKSIGIHHATFSLGKEFYKEPARLISELIKEDKNNKPFITLKHGESVVC